MLVISSAMGTAFTDLSSDVAIDTLIVELFFRDSPRFSLAYLIN